MSKYQIFATPGSFRANQLVLPDESGKILEAAERQIRGMEEAESFRRGNQELYLRAQQLAQNQERADRETNYRLETQGRQTYRKYLQLNNQTALENDRIAGQKTQQMYKDLSAFSKTAFEIYGQFEEQRKKKEQALATQLVLQAGLDYEQLTQLSSIDKKLSDSEFRQTEFMQGLIDQGISEDRIRAIEQLRRGSPARVYLNTQAAYQNSLLSYQPGLQIAIQELGPDATPEQIKAKTQSYFADFITNKFPNARPEMLESSGLIRSVRAINNQAVSKSSRDFAAKREVEIKATFRDDLQTTYNKRGLDGVMEVLQTSPSRWKREIFTDWAVAALKADKPYGLSEEDGQAILEYQLTIGNQKVPFAKQFIFEGGRISEAIRASRRREVTEYNLRQNEEKMQGEAQMAKMFDSFAVDDDGRIDAEELAALEERAIDLGLRDSDVLAYAKANSVSAETDRAIERYLGEKADNLTLTVEDVNGLKMGTNLRRRFLQIAKEQSATRESPIYKDHINAIEAAISQHPEIRANPITGASNYTVILMQSRYIQQYKSNLKRLDSPEEALSATLKQIEIMQSKKGAISMGMYSAIEKQVEQQAKSSKITFKKGDIILKAIAQKVFFDEPKWAASVVGEDLINQFNTDLKKTGQPPELLKTFAEKGGVDPITFFNYLAVGAGIEPINPLNDELQKLKESLPPVTRRLYDTYRTNERVTRANAVVSNASSQMPKRASFSGNEDYLKFRRAIIKQESGGNYQIVNPDSGAIGIGQVMPENVGPWTERYLGKRLTPEQFRYNNAAQDAVINGRFKDMLADQAKAGYSGEEMIRRAAAVWYSGQADLWNYNKPEYYNGRRYPSIAEYTKSIWNSFQRQ